MSKNTDLVKNTLVLGFGKLVAQIATFALLPIYTLVLSPDEFGTVDLIVTYVGLLAPLLIIQLDRAAFRYLIEARGNKEQSTIVISNTLYIVGITLLAILILYAGIASIIHIPYAGLIALGVIAMMTSTLLLQFARGFARNRLYAIASIVLGLTNLLVVVVLVVWLKAGVEGALYALAISHVTATTVLFIALRLHRYISISRSVIDRSMQHRLISFAWPLVPSSLSWWFIRAFDRTLVTIIVGVAANGVYAAANKYAAIFTALYTIFDMSWTESASEHIESKDRDKFFSAVYNTSFRFFTSLAIGLIAITPFVFNVMVGEDFMEAKYYIPILILGGFLSAVVGQYSAIYIAKKLTRQVLVTSISAAIISIVLNLVLISVIGTMGAAVALVCSFLVMAIWRHHDIKKYVTVKFESWLFIKIALAFLVTVSLYYIDNTYMNIVNIILTVSIAYLLSQDTLSQGAKKLLAKVRTKYE